MIIHADSPNKFGQTLFACLKKWGCIHSTYCVYSPTKMPFNGGHVDKPLDLGLLVAYLKNQTR